MKDGHMPTLAREIAAALATLPGILAVGFGGSEAAGRADAHSDLDLIVFITEAPPIWD